MFNQPLLRALCLALVFAAPFASRAQEVRSLTEFPSEILVKIFGYLSPKDLLAVSQLCKAFHPLVNDDFSKRLRTLTSQPLSPEAILVDKMQAATISPRAIYKTLHTPQLANALSTLLSQPVVDVDLTKPLPTGLSRFPNPLLRRLLFHTSAAHTLKIHDTLSAVPLPTSGRDQLLHLDLSHNRLTQFPETVTNCPMLQTLILSHNLITGPLPLTLGQLKNLEVLRLDHNQITDTFKNIPALPELLELDVSHNRLESLSKNLANFKRLHTLRAAHNALQELPPDLAGMQSLTHLDCRHNQLKTLPFNFVDQSKDGFNLHTLRLGHNQLRGFFEDVEREISLKNKEIFDVDKQIPILPYIFPKLRTLDIAANGLTTAPSQLLQRLGGWDNRLEHLDVSGNPLTILSARDLPKNLTHLESRNLNLQTAPNLSALPLAHLDLSHNTLNRLLSAVSLPPTLQHLNLGHNDLTRLPSLRQALQLTTLRIEGNHFSALGPDLSALPSLSQVYLESRQIRQLSESLSQLSQSQPLTALPGSSPSLNPLEFFNPDGQSIFTLSSDQRPQLRALAPPLPVIPPLPLPTQPPQQPQASGLSWGVIAGVSLVIAGTVYAVKKRLRKKRKSLPTAQARRRPTHDAQDLRQLITKINSQPTVQHDFMIPRP